MLLVIDVGNTNTVFGLYKHKTLVEHWRIETRKTKTSDEYGILFTSLIRQAGMKAEDIEHIIISSVVPILVHTYEQMCAKYFERTPMVVGPGIRTGMPIVTENPREVGADRIVNAIAAYDVYKQSCIIVDFGTATTFDCVSKKGEYLGGAIAPGFHISAEALFRETSKLPRIDVIRPRRAIGRNTVASMQSGLYYGYIGLVDETVRRIAAELDDKPRVVATGGIATLFHGDSRVIEETDEFLTLRGLCILHARNMGGGDA